MFSSSIGSRLLTLAVLPLAVLGGAYLGSEPLLLDNDADSCTTLALGKTAGINGPMATHNMDCLDCDFRMNKVPAMDWPEGSIRELTTIRGEYPIMVAEDRGETWKKENLKGTHDQLDAWVDGYPGNTGSIPQVNHTYALLEGGYGMMNEYGLSIGESTCQARFWNAPVGYGGKGVIEVSAMSRIALERTTKAKDAIQLMGDLAVDLGYYSCAYTDAAVEMYIGEGGEALTVVDSDEAWIFHILPDDTGTSAVWVAQRVPDNHIAVVANQFVIRKVDPNNSDFMYSSNLWEVAERNGLWNESMGLLDFTPTYAPVRAHSYYCTRRVWRAFSLANPTWGATEDGMCSDSWCTQYPFSVEVENKMNASDVIKILRDHYEGTPYDLTKGLAAGPYGNPNRWDSSNTIFNMTMNQELNGSFERSISIFRTSTSIVAEPRGGMPSVLANRIWFSQYAPSAAAYTPVYVAATKLPKEFTTGSLFEMDDDAAWWNFAVVANYAYSFYELAMVPIQDTIAGYEADVIKKVEEMEEKVMKSYEKMKGYQASTSKHAAKDAEKEEEKMLKLINDFSEDRAKKLVDDWKKLFKQIVVLFHDGYYATTLTGHTITMNKIFYPYWWLKAVGYVGQAINPYWEDPSIIEFAPNPNTEISGAGGGVYMALLACIVSMGVGYFMGKKDAKTTSTDSATNVAGSDLQTASYFSSTKQSQYQVIPDHHELEMEARAVHA